MPVATGHCSGQHSLGGGGVPGTPLVTDEAGAWFALLSGGSTAAPELPRGKAWPGEGLTDKLPSPTTG